MSLDGPSDTPIDGAGLRIGIAAARFNGTLVEALLARARAQLATAGAPEPEVVRVPGSSELPVAAALMAGSGRFDALLALGVVIAGATRHHEIIADSTAAAFQQLALETGVPVINGVIVTENASQAEERAAGPIDRGGEFARAALEMASLGKQWTRNTRS
jgi:6,7-dimethyl-8-ribityllumazine synthase